MDASLWWAPLGRLYTILKDSSTADNADAVSEVLQQQYQWLLNGVTSWKGPSNTSKQALAGKSVTVQGKKFPVADRLMDATNRFSAILDLDQFQTHLLLKRWSKETETATAQSQPFILEPLNTYSIIAYYYHERLHLIRSIQYLQLQGHTSRHPVLRETLDKLIKGGLEDKLILALRGNIERTQALVQLNPASKARAALPGTSTKQEDALQLWMADAGTLAMECILSAHQQQMDCLLLERCELLTCLILLYQLQCQPCTPMRSLELLRLLSTPLSSRQPITTALVQAAAEQEGKGGEGAEGKERISEETLSTMLTEYLSCVVLLISLDIPGHMTSTSSVHSADSLPLGGKTRDIHAEICNWPGGAPSMILWGAWAAIARLVEPCMDLGETISLKLQAAATLYGLFKPVAAMTEVVQGLLPVLGQQTRRVVLQAVSLMAAAFELGPTAQGSTGVHELWDLLGTLLKGDSQLCNQVWDASDVTLRPIRVLMDESAGLFPAVSWPLLQLLTQLSQGPEAAQSAYQYLRAHASLVGHHRGAEAGCYHCLGGTRMQVTQRLPWNLAPSITSMVLPVGTHGTHLPWPAVTDCPEPGGEHFIRWEVVGTAQQADLGPLLLLGRAVHILHVLTSCAYDQLPVDPALLQDLQSILGLISHLVTQYPACVEPLLATTVDATSSTTLPGADKAFTWLHAACAATQLLGRVCCGGLDATSDPALCTVVLDCMKHALVLINCTAQYYPGLVLVALQQLVDCSSNVQFPDEVSLTQLATIAMPGVLLASPPCLPHVQLEVAVHEYGVTEALLQLLDTFLRRGYHSQGVICDLVLHALLYLLPAHKQWRYKAVGLRWQLTTLILQVLGSSISAGSYLPPGFSQTGDLLATATPNSTRVTGLAALVLHHLLTNGDSLLLDTLPLPLPPTKRDEDTDPDADPDAEPPLPPPPPEHLPVLETATVALLQVLELLLVAAAASGVESALEERLLLGWSMKQDPPATLLCGLVTHPSSGATASTQGPAVAHQALEFLTTLQACVGLHQAWLGVSFSTILPPDSPALSNMAERIRPDRVGEDPQGAVLALRVLDACVPDHPALLHTLLYPPLGTAGRHKDEASAPNTAEAGPSQALPAGSAGPSGAVTNTTAPAAGQPAAKKHHGKAGTGGAATGDNNAALSSIGELLEACAKNKASVGAEVVAALLQLLGTLWQHPAAAHQATHSLQSNSHLWTCVEASITAAVEHTGDDDSPLPTQNQVSVQEAAASALQLLMLELAHSNRALQGRDGGSDGGRGRNSKAWEVLRSLVDKGHVHKLLGQHSCYVESLCMAATACQSLTYTECLELSVEVGAVDSAADSPGPHVREVDGVDTVQVAFVEACKKDLSPVLGLLHTGQAQRQDLQSVHDHLFEAGLTAPFLPHATSLPAAAQDVLTALTGNATPGSGAPVRQGSTAVERATCRPGMQVLSEALHRPRQTSSALLFSGPDAGQLSTVLVAGVSSPLMSTDYLVDATLHAQTASQELVSHTASLQSVCAMVTLALHDKSLSAALLKPRSGSGSAGAQESLVQVLTRALSHLVQLHTARLTAQDSSRLLLTSPWAGLCFSSGLQSVLCAAQLLLHVLSVVAGSGDTQQPAAIPRNLSLGDLAGAQTGAGGPVVSVEQCVALLQVLSGWLGAVRSLPTSGSTIKTQISGILTGACGLAVELCAKSLQPPTAAASSSSGHQDPSRNLPQMFALNQQLLAVLPVVWDACMEGWLTYGRATQVLVESSVSLLSPQDWLPLVQTRLDLARLLQVAAEEVGKIDTETQDNSTDGVQGEGIGLGPLHLAVLAADTPAGALWLTENGILPALLKMAYQILHTPGGRLTEHARVVLPVQPAGQRGVAVHTHRPEPPVPTEAGSIDTAGAYMAVDSVGGGERVVRSPLHSQWCALLGLTGSLIRSLSQHTSVEQESIDLLCTVDSRLLLALLPPHATRLQPLTLADLQERERALFLLTQLTKFQGTWHLARPSSLTQFRAAAVAFVSFAASAGSNGPVTLECPPQTAEEKAMAAQTTVLPRVDGWFRVCSLGASDPAALTTPSTATTTGPGATPGSPSPPTVTCSEYAARMAESLYTCVKYALIFLQLTSPQVGEGERGNVLGPGWPRASELAALQHQCWQVVVGMGDQVRGTLDPRRVRAGRLMIKIMQAVVDMQEVVGSGSSRMVGVAMLREQLPALDLALQRGEGLSMLPGIKHALHTMGSISLGTARTASEIPSLSG